MAGGGGNKKIFQYCTDPSRQEIFYLRALQGHSGRNPIDPSSQDNVFIPKVFFEYIYHIGCAINLLVIIGLMKSGKAACQEEEETRKDFSIVLDSSGTILYLRALRTQSYRSFITRQCRDSGRFL